MRRSRTFRWPITDRERLAIRGQSHMAAGGQIPMSADSPGKRNFDRPTEGCVPRSGHTTPRRHSRQKYGSAMVRDWHEWYRDYDDPASSLSRRLTAVTSAIHEHLDTAPFGPIRVLSLCAGDGRDLCAAAVGHARRTDIEGTLIELDPGLAGRAVANVAAAGITASIVCGDAGDPANFTGVVPVDLLMLCGIFGNISLEDVAQTIEAVPALCRTGATIVWTRHRKAPDATLQIRDWFVDAGCESLGFVSPGHGSFGVGTQRFTGTTAAAPSDMRLFTFRDDLW